jgi:hypothetical protein
VRWFTAELLSGCDAEGNVLPDSTFGEAVEAYNQHLAAIEDKLSPDVRSLAQLNLHDAIPTHVIAAHPEWLALEFVLDDGLRLIVTYRGWDIGGLGIPALRALMRLGDTFQVLQDEIDIATDGRFVHRLQFWPAGELVLLFSELDLRV